MKNKILIAIICAFLLVFGFFIWKFEQVQRQWVEVILETRPVDPRALLSGDYVRLAYEVAVVENLQDIEYSPIYLVLELDASGRVIAKDIQQEEPSEGVYIRTDKSDGWSQLELGIEQYYVPEGKGWEIQDLARAGNIEVRTSVFQGDIQILGLLLDGELVDFGQIETRNEYQ